MKTLINPGHPWHAVLAAIRYYTNCGLLQELSEQPI